MAVVQHPASSGVSEEGHNTPYIKSMFSILFIFLSRCNLLRGWAIGLKYQRLECCDEEFDWVEKRRELVLQVPGTCIAR